MKIQACLSAKSDEWATPKCIYLQVMSKGKGTMTKEDYKLIEEISNSEFPLIDFANDLEILYRMGRLEGFDYEAMQEDLAKIAKLFKHYYDEATKEK